MIHSIAAPELTEWLVKKLALRGEYPLELLSGVQPVVVLDNKNGGGGGGGGGNVTLVGISPGVLPIEVTQSPAAAVPLKVEQNTLPLKVEQNTLPLQVEEQGSIEAGRLCPWAGYNATKGKRPPKWGQRFQAYVLSPVAAGKYSQIQMRVASGTNKFVLLDRMSVDANHIRVALFNASVSGPSGTVQSEILDIDNWTSSVIVEPTSICQGMASASIVGARVGDWTFPDTQISYTVPLGIGLRPGNTVYLSPVSSGKWLSVVLYGTIWDLTEY